LEVGNSADRSRNNNNCSLLDKKEGPTYLSVYSPPMERGRRGLGAKAKGSDASFRKGRKLFAINERGIILLLESGSHFLSTREPQKKSKTTNRLSSSHVDENSTRRTYLF